MKIEANTRYGYGPAVLTEITDIVESYTDDHYSDGQIERLNSSLNSTREVLARLIDKICEKSILTPEEIILIIRGY